MPTKRQKNRNIQGNKIVISGRDALKNSANKESSHMPHVRAGCGFHESKKYGKKDRLKGKVSAKDYC